MNTITHVGRPTAQEVHFKQMSHQDHQMLKECHQRLVSVEAKLALSNSVKDRLREQQLMQFNLINKQSLELRIVKRNLDLLSRL